MLDCWRGLACLIVVVFHSAFYISQDCTRDSWLTSWTTRGWVGVPMFFVISGYCISATVESTRRKEHPVSVYFARRVRRIYPPWIVFTCIAAMFVGISEILWRGSFADEIHGVPRPWWLGPVRWIGNLTLIEGWRPHVIPPTSDWFMGHGWTLGYEEQFYAVTGVLLLIARPYFFQGTAFVTAATLACLPFRGSVSGFFFDGYWLQFAVGVAVYWAVARNAAFWRFTVGSALVCFAAVMPHSSYMLYTPNNFEQSMFVALVFGAVLLMLWPLDEHSEHHALTPLRLCGLWCYSIYLVHWPVCKLLSHICWDVGLKTDMATAIVTIPICLGASLLAAWPFHVYVERRFLNQQ